MNLVECLYCGAQYRGVICSKCNHAYIDGELVKIKGGKVPKWIIRLTLQDFNEETHIPIPQQKIEKQKFRKIKLPLISELPGEILQYYMSWYRFDESK